VPSLEGHGRGVQSHIYASTIARSSAGWKASGDGLPHPSRLRYTRDMTEAPAGRRVGTAVRLLERVFDPIASPLSFLLWVCTTVRVGARGDGGFAVVFRSPGVLRRLLRRPTPLHFGEAYIGGEIDIEGDMFAAMRAASDIEALRVPLGTRLGVFLGSFAL